MNRLSFAHQSVRLVRLLLLDEAFAVVAKCVENHLQVLRRVPRRVPRARRARRRRGAGPCTRVTLKNRYMAR